MNILFAKSPFIQPVTDLLREMGKTGLFTHDLLFIRPVKVSLEDFTIRIPSPEAMMLHKLIIAQRRTGRDKEFKKEKDLQQCSVLAEVVRDDELKQISQDYRLSKDA